MLWSAIWCAIVRLSALAVPVVVVDDSSVGPKPLSLLFLIRGSDERKFDRLSFHERGQITGFGLIADDPQMSAHSFTGRFGLMPRQAPLAVRVLLTLIESPRDVKFLQLSLEPARLVDHLRFGERLDRM